jgi:transcriptional regulator with XRE-family HTH domain
MRILHDVATERLIQWGRNIRSGRRLAGFETQLAFAEALGVTQGTVARWEAGQLAPSDTHKEKIAGLLHQEVRALFPLFAVPPAQVAAK